MIAVLSDVWAAVIAAVALILAGAIPVLIANARRTARQENIANVEARVSLVVTMLQKIQRDFDRHLDWHDAHSTGRARTRRDDD